MAHDPFTSLDQAGVGAMVHAAVLRIKQSHSIVKVRDENCLVEVVCYRTMLQQRGENWFAGTK